MLTTAILTLTSLAVYFGRKSAKAPTDSYAPILRRHMWCAIPAVALACVAVLIGPVVMEASGYHALATTHALVEIGRAHV